MREVNVVEERRTFIRMHPADNVATALDYLHVGTEIHEGEATQSLTLKGNIPFGHKFALVAIQKGSPVYKYGEIIGEATTDIAPGEHVHVHNVDSLRGRGDLHKEEPSQ